LRGEVIKRRKKEEEGGLGLFAEEKEKLVLPSGGKKGTSPVQKKGQDGPMGDYRGGTWIWGKEGKVAIQIVGGALVKRIPSSLGGNDREGVC